MKISVLMLSAVTFSALAQAQDPPATVPPANPTAEPAVPAAPAVPATKPALDAQAKFYAEQFRRLRGEINELKDAHAQQLLETEKLKTELKTLKADNAAMAQKLAGKFATEAELKALQDALKELDANRILDRDTLKNSIVKLGELINKVAQQKPATAEPVNPTRTVAQDFKYTEHKVDSREFLSTIIVAYNQHFKEEGLGKVTLSQVLKANPGLNPDRLTVCQKIKIPLPGEIQ